METLLLIVLVVAGLLIVGSVIHAAGRQIVAGCRRITLRYQTLSAWWRQRRPPPPPALTAPLTRWEEHDIPTWQRRGQPSPALDLSAPDTSPPPAAETKLPRRVVF